MKRAWVLPWLIAMPLGAVAAEYGGPLKEGAAVAFFGITFIDTSTEGAYDGERADQSARVALLEDEVRTRFAEEGFTLLPTEPIADRLETIANPADCNGCELRLATELAADYALVGEVQKVSNLILSMNLVMRDTGDGTMVRGLSVDIRSNTDESWLRGMRYIFKNHFFKE